MFLSLLTLLFISSYSLPIAVSTSFVAEKTDFESERTLSVDSSSINVALSNDDVLSGSLISATLTVSDPISSLTISNSSNHLHTSLIDNNDGTFTSSIQTNGEAGEYYVTLSALNNSSIDCDSSELTSLYVYSDGINDCISPYSMNEARAKYFINHVATEEELILLEKKEAPENFSPSITRYAAETHYASITYSGDDITADSSVYSGDFENKIIVEGTAVWYDENEIPQPLKDIYVVLWDDDFFWHEYCGATYTDEDGKFFFEIDNQNFLEFGRDLFVTFYSTSKATSVQSFWWGTYLYCAPKYNNVQNNSKIVYEIGIHSGFSDRASAFEICQAEKIPYDYIGEMNKEKLPRVPIFYPAFNGDGCYYNNILNYIAVGKKFYRDWDCLNHEYGHFINKTLNLCDCSIGGSHFVNEDLIGSHGKENGLKLAMSEGLASYFGLASQIYYANLYEGYPRVGDESYNSVNGVNIDYNRYRYGQSYDKSGEGNEFCVTSVLTKLLDGVARTDDNVSLGHETMWAAITSSCHKNISELIFTILSQNENKRSAIGRILELEGFSPILNVTQNSYLSVDGNDSCWTFSWINHGFVSGQPNKFVLTFEGTSSDSYSIENIVATSISLNSSQINSVLSLSGPTIKWHLRCYNTDSPVTGGYVTADSTAIKPSATVLALDVPSSEILVAEKTKWFKFTAPRTGTYHFESTSDLDLCGELFSNFVVDKTCPNRLAYNDDGGSDRNFLITSNLSSGQTVYIRVRGSGYSTSIFGSFYVKATVEHEHSYIDHFDSYSAEKHKAYCSCGVYVLRPHAIRSGSTRTIHGRTYADCIDCGALLDLGSGFFIVGPSANQNSQT